MFPILQNSLIVLLIIITNRQINGQQQQQQQNVRFHEIRHWRYINFTWPNELMYQNAINTNQYIPDNVLISGIKNFDNFYYITLPRMKNGVPATLARIPMAFNNNEPSPKFEPYPSWAMNSIENCDNLQNVQNIEIDNRNGKLWIIDVGRIQTLTQQPINRCPPKLIVHDIRENRTRIVYHFPENIASSNSSYLYDLVIDNLEDGSSYAYITDNSANDPGIIVYSMKENRSWKIRQHRSMFADQTNFVVNGITITAPINIAGIALGPRIINNNNHHQNIVINDDRTVYFSPLSSKHLYSINTTSLRNEQYLKMNHNLDGIIKDHGMKSSQSVGMIMDDHGVLYYGLLELNGIGQWDTTITTTTFENGQKLIAQDAKFIEWPNSFTFDNNGNLIVLINRLNRFIFQRFDRNQINFRLISANLGSRRSYIDTNDEQFNYQRINDSSSSTNTTTTRLTTLPPPPPLIHQHQPSSAYKSSSINCNILIGIHLLLSTLLII